MSNLIDLTGKRLGKLVVISQAPRLLKKKARWLCRCDCGNETFVTSDSLLKKKNPTRACGCGRRTMGRGLLDLAGQRFGRLTVLELGVPTKINPNRSIVFWKCKCDCGAVVSVRSNCLRMGNSKSCGCLERELTSQRSTTHGLRDTPVYQWWQGMLNRCYLKSFPAYKDYGERGIMVCEFLRASPVNLLALLGEKPNPASSMGRPDNDGPYSCGGCSECLTKGWKLNLRWETKSQQARNKRNTIWLTVGGVRKCVADWADITGINSSTIKTRIKHGHAPLAPVKK